MQRWVGEEMASSSNPTILGQVTALLCASVSPLGSMWLSIPNLLGLLGEQMRPRRESRRPVVVSQGSADTLMPGSYLPRLPGLGKSPEQGWPGPTRPA